MTSLRRKMDKVCDKCGDLGFEEYIVTCYQCKKASEHMYCMQGQVLTIPDIWYCEICKLNTQVARAGNGQDSHIDRMPVRSGSSDLERSKTPLKKIPPMNYWGSPEQSTDGEKQVSGTKKLSCSPDNSLKMVDTGKERRVSVSGSPDKPVTQQLSHNTCFRTVENAKVKFIPSEEVAFLTSRGRTARRWRNLGASRRQIDLENGKPPPSLRRMSTDVSTSHNPNTLKVLPQTNKGSVHAEVHFSHMKHAMTTELARNNQNAKSEKRKASEIEASAGSCKKKLNKEYVGAEGYLSSTNLTTPTVSDVPVLPIDEQRNRATVKALEGADEPPVPHVSGKHVQAFVDAEVKDSPMNNDRPADSKHIDYRLLDTNEKNEKMSTGNVVRPDASLSGFQETDLLLTLITSPCEKTPNRLTPGACWKGTFEVFDVVYHSYRIQAHLPCQMFCKAHEITKKLPEKLKLKILPCVDTWPQAFQITPPTCEDIALYFFSSEFGRHKEKYTRLLEHIESSDFAMKTCIDGVELLVYTSKQLPQDSQSEFSIHFTNFSDKKNTSKDSKQLPQDSQRIDAEPFLWGVFRHLKHKKQCQDKQQQSLSFISAAVMNSTRPGQFDVSSDTSCQEVDEVIDMVGGSEIDRIDRPILRIDSPPGFSKPISRDASGFSKPISSDVSHDIRSLTKFLPHVPPGFSTTTFKHGSSSSDLTPKGQNLCMKDKRGPVSFSSGERHATTNLGACEGQPKCHQVSGHWHKSVEHSFSNRLAEKKKEFNSVDRYSYGKEKTPPWTDTKSCSASISLPSLSAKKKVDSSYEKPLQKSCTIFGEVVLSSTPSSNEKQKSRFFKKPTYYRDRDSRMTDTEAHCLHMNMTPNSTNGKGHRPSGKPSDKNFAKVAQVGEGVWPSGTGIMESKITGCMMVPKATEGNEEMDNQSTMDRRQEMKMIAPSKQISKRVKEKMERHCNSNPENKQISLVSENYGSPSSSLIQPLLSGSKNRTDARKQDNGI